MTLVGGETPEQYWARMEKYRTDPTPLPMDEEPATNRLLDNAEGEVWKFEEEETGAHWSRDLVYLTDMDIEALKAGKVLAISVSHEYTVIVLYRPSGK